MITLGKVFKLYRLTNDMRTKEAAKLAGVSPTYISEIEADHKNPSTLTLKDLSKTYRVPASEFFRIEEEATENNYSFQQAFLAVVKSWFKYNGDEQN